MNSFAADESFLREQGNEYKQTLENLEQTQEYLIRVNTLVNGRSIASRCEKLKALNAETRE